MVARDDSVIRGSLIACMIFLVLALALNFFLYRWGSTLSIEAETAKGRLDTTAAQSRSMSKQLDRLKAMMGAGGFTAAQIEEMKSNTSDDPEMTKIEQQFARDMSNFGAEVPPEERTYPKLPEYLINAIRSRNEQYAIAQREKTQIKTDADAQIANAEKSLKIAEDQAASANKKANDLSAEFDEERARMTQENEQTLDKMNRITQDFGKLRRKADSEKSQLTQKAVELKTTIDVLKKKIAIALNDRFETTQGEIRYVKGGGKIVTINLGSADALRPNVTFGVIDGEETRLQDADLKASIQVIEIQGPHLASARVVGLPEIRNPIIPGDKVYSPFWAPGRKVRISLAGAIDIDGDGRPDNDAVRGQILAAGGEIAAELLPSGKVTGKLDANIRFMVVGAEPDVSQKGSADRNNDEILKQLTKFKELAGEYGITVIPAWKLESYLKTIDDTLTTPLGSASRAEDFEPRSIINRRRVPTEMSSMYKRQEENLQRGNKVVAP